MKLHDVLRSGVNSLDLDPEFADKAQLLIDHANTGIRNIYDAVSGNLSLSDNVKCDVLSATFSHGVAQNVKLKKLKTIGGALVLGADGQIVMGQPLVKMATDGSANVTLWFNDTTATRVPVTLLCFEEGTASKTTPTYSSGGGAGTDGVYAAYRRQDAAGQSIADSTATIVNFDVQEEDTDTAVATGAAWKFTVPASKGGIYQVESQVIMDGAGNDDLTQLILSVFKNGTEAKRLFQQTTDAGGMRESGAGGACSLRLAAADYIDIRIRQTNVTGDAHSTTGGAEYVYVSIYRISDLA